MGTHLLLPVGLLTLLSGCGEPFVSVAKPSAITFEGAMTELGRGFTAFETASSNRPRGLVPCTVNVTFDVAVVAQASDSLNSGRTGQLVVTGVSSQATDSSSISGVFSRSRSANRGSKIDVQLRHLQCLPTDTRAAMGEQIRDVANAIDTTDGITILSIPSRGD